VKFYYSLNFSFERKAMHITTKFFFNMFRYVFFLCFSLLFLENNTYSAAADDDLSMGGPDDKKTLFPHAPVVDSRVETCAIPATFTADAPDVPMDAGYRLKPKVLLAAAGGADTAAAAANPLFSPPAPSLALISPLSRVITISSNHVEAHTFKRKKPVDSFQVSFMYKGLFLSCLTFSSALHTPSENILQIPGTNGDIIFSINGKKRHAIPAKGIASLQLFFQNEEGLNLSSFNISIKEVRTRFSE
jgi:hypothetical protein